MNRRQVLRILDANFNRSREGLRVCEEIARFVLEDKAATRVLKNARHAISRCLIECGVPFSKFLESRDTGSDVGKKPEVFGRSARGGSLGLFAANIQRAKEALRVLEEISKVFSPSLAVKFKKIRFLVYELEKKILPKLEALRDRRSRGLKKRPRS